jgi:hypothetical protein
MPMSKSSGGEKHPPTTIPRPRHTSELRGHSRISSSSTTRTTVKDDRRHHGPASRKSKTPRNEQPSITFLEHFKLSFKQTIQGIVRNLKHACAICALWIPPFVAIFIAGLVIWYLPFVALSISLHCAGGVFGHIIFSLLHWKYYADAEVKGAGLFKIFGYELVVRQSGSTKLETIGLVHSLRGCVKWFMTSFFSLTSRLMQGGIKEEPSHLDELGQTPVTRYLTEAASKTPIIKKFRFGLSSGGPSSTRQLSRYNVPSSHNYFIKVSLRNNSWASPRLSDLLLVGSIGLIFSNTRDQDEKSLANRILLLRIQIALEKLREIDQVSAGIYQLLLDLTPPSDLLSVAAVINNVEVFQELMGRVAKLLYRKRDRAFQDAWWHDTVYPSRLSDIDIKELNDWIKICVHILSSKRNKEHTALQEMNRELMQERWKGKMQKLPRGKKERVGEGARAVVPVIGKDLTRMEIAVVDNTQEVKVGAYSGVAGDLAGM